MDPGDLEPPEWLQVPTGSKRPSPSPSEGEEDREVKKFRTQPSNVDEDQEFQSNEFGFPFTDFPLQDFSSNQPERLLSNHDVHGMPFSTTSGFDMGSEVSAAPFTAGGTDYATYFDELPTTAVYEDFVTEDNTYWGDFFSQDPNQASASFIYGHSSTGAEYAEQFGGVTAADVAFPDQFQGAFVSEGEVPAAIQDPTPGLGVLKRVESIPIRRAQVDGPPLQNPTASPPKESRDVLMDCDACFGVVIATPVSSFTQEDGARCIPVDLKPFGHYFILRSQASDTHAGILDNSELLKILGQFPLRLDATLLIPESKVAKQPSRMKSKNKNAAAPVKTYHLRIALHGFKSDKDLIGKLLSDGGFFLQHPSAAELLPDVEYDNPHYLLRPGAKMPRMEDLDMELDGYTPSQDELEDDISNSNLLRIFESAALAADGGQVTHLGATPSPRLRSVLMPHQITSLAFMLEKESGFMEEPKFPSLWRTEHSKGGATTQYRHVITRHLERRPYPVLGGVLADDMGLGKTLSVLAVICSSLDFHANIERPADNQGYRRTLIVAPKSTIHSWETQASRHVHEGQLRVGRYHGPGREELAKDLLDADVVITTYETLRSDFATPKRSPIYSSQWLRLVLDEAHHVRNRSSQVFSSVCQLKARYRWCLTGTPVHNSLDDYGALLSFVRVYPFRAKSQFTTYIVKPVQEKHELGTQRLQELVRATCLRRTKQQTLASGLLSLPHRSEKTCLVYLHHDDQNLYDSVKKVLQKTASGSEKPLRKDVSAKAKEKNVMVLLNSLRLICNHGEELVPDLPKTIMEKNSALCISRIQRQIHAPACSSCGGETSGSTACTESQGSLCVDCVNSDTLLANTQLGINFVPGDQNLAPKSASMGRPTLRKTLRPSAKVLALINNLRQESSIKDQTHKARKSVVFTYWVKMLDLIEEALRAQNIGWQRIDGQTKLEDRRRAVFEFSSRSDCTVMLASIGSAAEGIDLTAASIVHLIEPHWNPMVEAQAVDRVYRIGQTQVVTVIRYIVPNSVETVSVFSVVWNIELQAADCAAQYVQVVQQEKMNIINQANSPSSITEPDQAVARQKALERVLA